MEILIIVVVLLFIIVTLLACDAIDHLWPDSNITQH